MFDELVREKTAQLALHGGTKTWEISLFFVPFLISKYGKGVLKWMLIKLSNYPMKL
jgi:hypothetical protein